MPSLKVLIKFVGIPHVHAGFYQTVFITHWSYFLVKLLEVGLEYGLGLEYAFG